MPECTNCGSPVEGSDNFCSNCGEPQNEQARTQLNNVIEKQAEKKAGSAGAMSSRDELMSRVSYALGFVFVVAGISLLPNLGGIPILLGGILLFPAVRMQWARLLGSPLKAEANAAIAVVLALIGAVISYFL